MPVLEKGGLARPGGSRAGRWPVQLRFPAGLTSEEYVTQEAWREASLPQCPLHPQGGCSLARHGTYERVNPPGARVARWYCREGHCTFSLLPDCLAARFRGTLFAIEQVVLAVEQASSLEAAADRLRPEIELPGAIRWTRRRVKPVHGALSALVSLMPERFSGAQPTVTALRGHVGHDGVLPALRAIATAYLPFLPPPLGFRPPSITGGEHDAPRQHQMGPDPPGPNG
ncbi:MAG: hypothetical protein QNJ87_13890 [Gammaproteobacteria bacterium]|nr:hypothetical protein [Gammaproteobacteria bacterium]MDJ0892853.1 hypothetical protein [Gammaproteobacteria bacterium]